MFPLPVPSGAVAVLDIEHLPEEEVERLAAEGSLVVIATDSRTFRVRPTADGLLVRTPTAGARFRKATRRGLVLAAAVGGLLYVADTWAEQKGDPVIYTTPTGETVAVRGGHASTVSVEHGMVPTTPVPSPSRMEPVARAATRPSLAPAKPLPRATPDLPSQAAERATTAMRNRPEPVRAKPVKQATPTPSPTTRSAVEVAVDLPVLPRVEVMLAP
jgi:hypothetical protein